MRSLLPSSGSLTYAGVALALLVHGLVAVPVLAVPPIGFQENWAGTSLQGWTGGSTYVNPGTGGVGGAADGFLRVSTSSASPLGTVNPGAPYPGNWAAAGIQYVIVSLNDVGAANPLSIHFSIGNGANFWQYNPAFSPPRNTWGQFIVNLTQAASFTRIIGSGTFAQALANVDRIHFRHDLAPYTQTPDFIQGDVGIDRLIIGDASTATQPSTWGRIKRLYRDAR